MRHIFSYVCLLLLVICCWDCMARHIKDKKPVSDDSTASYEHKSHSHEDKLHSHEHKSHSHEDKLHSHGDKSHSHEHGSSSDEDSSSKEKKSPCTDGKKSKGETDIDCGGKKCAKCDINKICLGNDDCKSGSCKNKRCAEQPTKPTKKPPTTTTGRATQPSRTTTSPKIVTTTMSETTTTTAAPETEETTTVAPETEEPATASPETEEPATAAPETEEPTTEALEIKVTATTSPTCDFDCENGGTCTGHNECTCTTGFSGQTCEVQSVGLCLNGETFDTEPLLLITFGNGSAQYSSATPASFDFSTTYRQGFQPVTNDGMFSFVNSVHDDFYGAWHTGATDHSEDNNGYMYLVNADFTPGQFYDGIVDNLCIGLRYEFSVYLANLCKSNSNIKPNVLFEVRSVDDNTLLAQLESGDVDAHDMLTWGKYGFSFIATSHSVNLLMISNAPGGGGNDIVIDDIALRVCAHRGAGFCPSK